MGEDGVLFADGIESDYLEFVEGQSVRIGIAEQRLNLVVPANPTNPTNPANPANPTNPA